MFADHFVSLRRFWNRIGPAHALVVALLAGGIALVDVSPAVPAPTCKPALVFKEARFSEIYLETMLRKWTAVLSVDASRCATTAGRFGIMFSRLKENAPEIEFVEPFVWKPDRVEVSVDFWADEAVEDYRLTEIPTCPCRD